MTVSLPSAEDMHRQSETDERKLSGLLWALCADYGVYLISVSTLYRLLYSIFP